MREYDASLIVALALAVPCVVVAQRPPVARTGQMVRAITDAPVGRSTIIGTVSRVQLDTLVVDVAGGTLTLPVASIRRLSIGAPRTAWNGFLSGGAQGLEFGAVVAATSEIALLVTHVNDTRVQSRLAAVTIGIAGATGATVGAIRRAVRWRRVR